jgi:hypothetical protein
MYLPWFGGIRGDEDIAGMHVGMEIGVAEDLGEEDLDASAGEPRNVHSRLAKAIHLADRDARHPFHHHRFGAAIVPMHRRHEQER